MFILYSNIVKDQCDIEQNVKGFHQTIHQTISNTFGGTIHQTISNTFGGTIRKIVRKTVRAHLSLSHPYPVIPPISR